jgi:putative methionine-R-sulfoxide reductase with GAF domain
VEARLPLLPLLAFRWEVGEEIVGEFDIDSDTVGAFIQEEEALLDEVAALTRVAASYEAS